MLRHLISGPQQQVCFIGLRKVSTELRILVISKSELGLNLCQMLESAKTLEGLVRVKLLSGAY